jgi:hypothetical protein
MAKTRKRPFASVARRLGSDDVLVRACVRACVRAKSILPLRSTTALALYANVAQPAKERVQPDGKET